MSPVFSKEVFLSKLLFKTSKVESLGKFHRNVAKYLAPKLEGNNPKELMSYINNAINAQVLDENAKVLKGLLYSDAAMSSQYPVVPCICSGLSRGEYVQTLEFLCAEDCGNVSVAEAYLDAAYKGSTSEEIWHIFTRTGMQIDEYVKSAPRHIFADIEPESLEIKRRRALAHMLTLRSEGISMKDFDAIVAIHVVLGAETYPFEYIEPLSRYIWRELKTELDSKIHSLTLDILKDAAVKCNNQFLQTILMEQEGSDWDIPDDVAETFFIKTPLTMNDIRTACADGYAAISYGPIEKVCTEYQSSHFVLTVGNPKEHDLYAELLALDIVRTCQYYSRETEWPLNFDETLASYSEYVQKFLIDMKPSTLSKNANLVMHVFEDPHASSDLIAPTIGWCCPNPVHVSTKWCTPYRLARRFENDQLFKRVQRYQDDFTYTDVPCHLNYTASLVCYVHCVSDSPLPKLPVIAPMLPGLYPIRFYQALMQSIPTGTKEV